MTTLLERVARAIFPEAYRGAGFGGDAEAWADALARTRLGIEAMREPTEVMSDAAWASQEFHDDGHPDEVFRAMIDAALS